LPGNWKTYFLKVGLFPKRVRLEGQILRKENFIGLTIGGHYFEHREDSRERPKPFT